jgi:outer membrane lipoprotein LolB
VSTARRRLLATTLCGVLLLAGCATPVRPGNGAAQPESWSGRLSLRVDSEPVQSFAALFDLRGTPERGTLTLTTPLGSTLAELQWSPGEAWLKNGSETRRYSSVDALIQAATGAAIPVDALFGWLGGRDDTVTGWRPDLTQWSAGKLQAVRESPLPRSDLRIVFERS